MIDLHCHLLPAVDDGARSIQEALALIRLAVEDGIDTIVLTPHVYAGRWDNDLLTLQPRFEAFRHLVAMKHPQMTLMLGAEAHLLPESLYLIETGRMPFLGTLDGRPVLLLELSDARIPPFASSAIRHLVDTGIQPVIAHPERNKAIMQSPDLAGSLMELGCLMQVTAGSLTGHFGLRARATALTLLDRGWIDIIASDAHHPRRRPPRMTQARAIIAERAGEATAERLTRTFPAAIVADRLERDGSPAGDLTKATVSSRSRLSHWTPAAPTPASRPASSNAVWPDSLWQPASPVPSAQSTPAASPLGSADVPSRAGSGRPISSQGHLSSKPRPTPASALGSLSASAPAPLSAQKPAPLSAPKPAPESASMPEQTPAQFPEQTHALTPLSRAALHPGAPRVFGANVPRRKP